MIITIKIEIQVWVYVWSDFMDRNKQFKIANFKLFFLETPNQKPYFFNFFTNHMFQNTIIKFLKLITYDEQQPKRGLLRLLPSLFIELGWHEKRNLMQVN